MTSDDDYMKQAIKDHAKSHALSKKDSPKNTWNKVKLQNRYRARWAKGKTGIGLDEHRATHA